MKLRLQRTLKGKFVKLLDGYHLLIAEDNPTNQIVVAKMIEQLGGTFDMASDGVEAIKLFDPKKHDLALLDIEMPKKSGLEVIRFIRERADTSKEFPIIALTAFVLSEHRSKIRDTGADAIIAKPIVDIQKFGEELATYLNANDERKFDPLALETLRTNMGDEIMPELIASLQSDLRKIQDELRAVPSAENQGEAVKSLAHSLASLAKMTGAVTLAKQAQEAETSAQNSKGADFEAQTQTLIGGIDELLQFIEDQTPDDE